MNPSNSPSQRHAVADSTKKEVVLKPSEEIAIGIQIASARHLIATLGLQGIMREARSFTSVLDYLKYILLEGLTAQEDLNLIFNNSNVIAKIQTEPEWRQELTRLEREFPSETIVQLICYSIRRAMRNIERGL